MARYFNGDTGEEITEEEARHLLFPKTWTCFRCRETISDETHRKHPFLCDECFDWLESSYNYELKQMQEVYPHADEADFLEMLHEYYEFKCKQYDDSRKKLWADATEEIRRRLKEEQNLCQK